MRTRLAGSVRPHRDFAAAGSTVQLQSRGALPKPLRDEYDLNEGDVLYLEYGGGTFVLTPLESVGPSLAREIERLREEAGLPAKQLMKHLTDERETLTDEQYGENPPEGASE